MRAKRSALRRAFISIYHTQVQNDIRVWTLNKRPDMSYLYNSQVKCGASDGWQRPGCPITGWEAAHFLFPHCWGHSEDESKPGRRALVWTRLVIFFFLDIIGGLSVRPANGLLHWSVKAVSFPRFSIWLRKLLSRSRLEQLMMYSQAQDGFCCNNLPDPAGSGCHSEQEKLLMYMTNYGTVH